MAIFSLPLPKINELLRINAKLTIGVFGIQITDIGIGISKCCAVGSVFGIPTHH